MVERGRWMKPKVQYIDRKCTLCNDSDIQDEYHIVLKCAYYNEVRRKYIKPYYQTKLLICYPFLCVFNRIFHSDFNYYL